MIHTSTWLVAAGQLALLIGLGACYLSAPGLVHTAEGGISNYGVYRPTAMTYTFALLLGALGNGLAGYFASKQSTLLAALLFTLAAFYLAILISTYSYQHSQEQRNIHIILGGSIYTVQLLAGLWAAWQLRSNPAVIALFAIQITGSALSLASILNIVTLLLIGQAIAGVSFSILLVILTQHILAP